MAFDIRWEPVEAIYIGPTWQRNPEWDGIDPLGEFVLPEFTLGWQVLDWIEANLLGDEVGEDGKLLPFKPTREQARFLLWLYAIDHTGRFLYRDVVLQRLKGWGKDPLAAVISAVEFVGPCRFGGWLKDDYPALDLKAGEPLAIEHPRAWVQVAAVSESQTKNTMKIFHGLFTDECKAKHSIDLGKFVIYAYKGARTIEAVTSSPKALEGNRPTFVIRNETHHWISSNDGLEMADVISRNATKSKGGASRALSITNAYEPHEDSVAQRQRESWERENAGLAIKTGVLYDSIEAPEHALLTLTDEWLEAHYPEGVTREEYEEIVRAYISAVVVAIRGDAVWLDVETIVNSVLSGTEAPSVSRRFWYNQIVSAEDAWLTEAAIKAAIDPLAAAERERISKTSANILHAGWIVAPDEEIVMFFDGSKSDDATALVGCRLSDGYVFTIGVWEKPPKEREESKGWVVPRGKVDARVHEAFRRFKIVGFWADPSHTKDDEDQTARYWDGLIDGWHREYKDRLIYWSIQTGNNAHSVMWDMTSPERTKQFTAAAEVFVEELEAKNDRDEYASLFTIDGHPAMLAHLKHARDFPNQYGTSLWKGHRESAKKIDLAVAAVGARMLRRLVLNKGTEEKKPVGGMVWGML